MMAVQCKDIVQNKGLKNNKISHFCSISGFLDAFIFSFSNILVFFYKINIQNQNSIFFVKNVVLWFHVNAILNFALQLHPECIVLVMF
jgi:hypothetical protein